MKNLLGVVVLAALASAFAQQPEKGSYSNCDFHIAKSTICGVFGSAPNGDNQSYITIREQNDTVGLTYLSLECRRKAAMELYLESKNPLMTQTDFDAEVWPRVQFRTDNGPLKSLEVEGAYEYDSSGLPSSQVNALQLSDPRDFLQAMASANSRVQVVIQRRGMTSLTYNFPTYGLETAMKSVRFCDPLG